MNVLLLVFLLVVFVMITAGVLLMVYFSRMAREHRAAANAPRLRAEAQVVDKRSEIVGGGELANTQRYFVTFQFPDGHRAELSVTGPESGMLTPGDRGTLEWQGSRFVGFARQILR